MLRAMDAAVSGLRAHQNKLDVIGQNIANVNTAGYKSQAYMFKEAMYQTSTTSTQGTTTAGGVNPAQYGYGTLMGSISVDVTAGTPTQLGGLTATIDGEGYFITNSNPDADGSAASLKTSNYEFTRVGMFKIDSRGYLVDCNSNNFVFGYPATDFAIDGNGNVTSTLETTTLGPISIPTTFTEGEVPVADNVAINSKGEITVSIQVPIDGAYVEKEFVIGRVAIATFQNPEGLTKSGGSYYTASTTDNSGSVRVAAAGGDETNGVAASLLAGYVESSNVDMAKEFSDLITTQRGFQANTKLVTVSDEVLEELVNMKR